MILIIIKVQNVKPALSSGRTDVHDVILFTLMAWMSCIKLWENFITKQKATQLKQQVLLVSMFI